jgi:hypothetical protein
MRLDEKSRTLIDVGWKRENNSLKHLDSDTGAISGFILYRTVMSDEEDPYLLLRFYPNPGAFNPLSEISINELCGALTTHWTRADQ